MRQNVRDNVSQKAGQSIISLKSQGRIALLWDFFRNFTPEINKMIIMRIKNIVLMAAAATIAALTGCNSKENKVGETDFVDDVKMALDGQQPDKL